MAEESRDPVVEVVYATAERQIIVPVPTEHGLTARAAVDRSGLTERFPEILDAPLVLGSFGRRLEPDEVLRSGDRIEICRPLRADPRRMRHDLLADGRVMGGGTGEKRRDWPKRPAGGE